MPDNGGKRLKEEYETIDLLEILRLLKKNLLVIFAVTILLAVAGYLVSAFAMTPQYEASATLIVNSREDQATTQAPITNDQLTSATKLVDTYAVILTSDTVLDKTISNLNLNMSYSDLVERVRIESVNSTQVTSHHWPCQYHAYDCLYSMLRHSFTGWSAIDRREND
jgi:capsular polysaccharide biosynthesis protein